MIKRRSSMGPPNVKWVKVIAPGIVAAGQSAPETLSRLGPMGFKTVINLRPPGEGGPVNERELVESQGLRYVSVPLTAATFSLADVLAVEKVIGDPASGPSCFIARSPSVSGEPGPRSWPAAASASTKRSRKAGLTSGPMEEAVKRVLAAPSR